jgi:nucleotide-binding universal stress UspA family protein
MGHTRIAIRHILCPVDFSEPSTRAMEHAVRMAGFFDATVHALHVVPTMFDAIEPVLIAPADAHQGPREKAVRELAAFVEPFQEWHVPIEQTVCLGSPARDIEAAAADLPADLVVMGTHGRSGIARFVFGSVTERVMHRVPCPVLAIGAHEDAPPTAPPYRRILCPTKLVPGSEHALDFALALAARSDSRLEVLHVIESMPPGADGDPFEGAPEFQGLRTRMVAEADAELRAAIPRALDNWCSVVRRVATGDAAPAILEAARTGGAEVIVMGVHGTGVERALFGSTTRRVLRDAPCSVLVLRQPRARKAARKSASLDAATAR